MKYRIFQGLLGLAAVLALAGCVTKRVEYNEKYVPGSDAPEQILGRALLLAEPPDCDFTFTGRPDSYYSGGLTLILPLGEITTEIAQNVFDDMFAQGCDRSDKMDPSGRYRAILKVRPLSFWYGFNQLRNLTMAVTPQIRVNLEVSLLDENRQTIFSQVYDSGVANDKTVLGTARPDETINRHTHRVVADLLHKAAADVARTLMARPDLRAGGAALPPAPDPGGGEPAEERLRKLKGLYEQGLISPEAYDQKQREILSDY